MWKIIIEMEGDEPEDDDEVDDTVEKVAKALDRADFNYRDITL